ncbi:MAG TPA: hypothetical protein VE643_09525 [Nitrososphaeraceae archaeon]|nr:hypothetical protein [Nitrososphaeraceae archaeon]
METYDLIDFFIPRNDRIFPPNKIKVSIEAIHNDTIVRKMYKGIGVCNVSQIIEPADLEKICKYYLVWYKMPNSRYRQHTSNTANFQFSEYIDEFLYDPAELPSYNKVQECIEILKDGWNHPIEIIVAYDTAINLGLIVAGAEHGLALYYIKQTEEERSQILLQQNNTVNLCQMNSLQCRNIFYHDFAKLFQADKFK